MLSIKTLTTPRQAANYYQNYYDANVNQWYGLGAKELGLAGQVDFAQFESMLAGELPNGVKMLQGYDKQGNPKRRAGYDLTFSAPKSLSVLALVANDDRLIKAHTQAVVKTLSHIEEHVIATRVKTNDKTVITPTKNMVASLHLHNDSRELDPNLHTHCVIANVTKIADRWRSIYGDYFYQQKMDLGFYYRNELVKIIKELGYEINITGNNGLFEIQGVDKEILKLFSKRRLQIEAKLATMDFNSSKAADFANLLTRKSKTAGQAKQYWSQELQDSGYSLQDLEKFIANSKARGSIKAVPLDVLAKDAVNRAISEQTTSNRSFSLEGLINTAKRYSLGVDIPEKFYRIGIEDKIKAREILAVSNKFKTKVTIAVEDKLINRIKTRDAWRIDGMPLGIGVKLLGATYLKNNPHAKTFENLLLSKARLAIIESSNLSNQAEFLSKFYTIIPNKAFIHNLHPTKKIAQNFHDKTGIASKSLYGFLKYTEKLIDNPVAAKQSHKFKNIWIIHMAEQLDLNKVNEIINKAVTLDTKVILMADTTKQGLAAYTTLKPHCPLYKLDNRAVSAKDRFLSSYKALENNKQIEVTDNLYHKATDWLLTKDLTKVSLYALNNRDDINALIQEKLIASERLGREALNTTRLKEIYLTSEEKKLASSFIVGDIIKLNAHWQVKDLDEANQALILERYGREKEFKLGSSNFKAYQKIATEIRANDILVWQDSYVKDDKLLLTRGDRLVVELVSPYSFIVTKDNGVRLELNKDDLNTATWDYGYCQRPTIGSNNALILDKNTLYKFGTKEFNSISVDKLFTNDRNIKDRITSNLNITADNYYFKHATNKIQQIVTRFSEHKLATNFELKPINNTTYDFFRACEAIDYGLTKLAERHAVFTKKMLMASSRDVSIPQEFLEQAYNEAKNQGLLLEQDDNIIPKEIILMEQFCIELMQTEKLKLSPITSADNVRKHLSTKGLTPDQQQAILQSSITKDRFIGIHGAPGVGKTTLLKELKLIGRKAGIDFIGLTQSASARLNLAEKITHNGESFISAGISSYTIASFIIKANNLLRNDLATAKTELNGKMLLVDEASLVSLQDMYELMHISKTLDCKLACLGDTKQLPPIEASKIYELLLIAGMTRSIVRTNVRLKDYVALQVVADLYANNIDAALAKLAPNLVEIAEYEPRIKAMADTYLAIYKENPLVMLPKNQDRVVFNNFVREGLKARGKLTGEPINTTILVTKDMPNIAKTKITSYEPNDMVLFNRNINRLGIARGDYCMVKGLENNKVSLKLPNNKIVSWLPKKYAGYQKGGVEVFKLETRELMRGDVIRWRKNDESRGIINSETATVINTGKNIEVLLKNQLTLKLNPEEFKNTHFDHAYGATTHVAQGLDSKWCLGTIGGSASKLGDKYPPINNLCSFLVMASRGDNFIFFVDNLRDYQQAISENIDIKQAAKPLLDTKLLAAELKFRQAIARMDGLARPTKTQIAELEQLQATAKTLTQRQIKTYSKEDVIYTLHQNVINNVSHWKGAVPTQKTKLEARWGKKGSFAVIHSGAKTGCWSDFESGDAGNNLLSLYMKLHNLQAQDFPQVLATLGRDNGVMAREPKGESRTNLPIEDKEIKSKIARAQRLYKSGKKITNTIAEKYIRNRGIKGRLPEDFRFVKQCFHYQLGKKIPALLIPARDQNNQIVALNRIYLNPDGTKLKANFKDQQGNILSATPKLAMAQVKGKTIEINKGKIPGVCYISEGSENALCIKDLKPNHDIKACVSINNLGHIKLNPGTQTVVIVADNDGSNKATKQALIKAVSCYLKQDLHVKIALPQTNNPEQKLDLNDVYKSAGKIAAKDILDNTITINNIKELGAIEEPLAVSFRKLTEEITPEKAPKNIGDFER